MNSDALINGAIPTVFRTKTTPRRAGRRLTPMFFLATALAMPGLAQAQHWRTVSDNDGIKMEARTVAGERFDELRVSTLVAVAPETIADYLVGRYLDERNKNVSRTFVKRSRELTIWSDVLSAPAISRRCYSMRFERSQIQADGEIKVRFSSLGYIGKKPESDCIELRSRGEWVMAPAGKGTRLSYVSLTDVGGKAPAILVRRSLSAAAIMSVRKVAAGAAGLKLPRGVQDR